MITRQIDPAEGFRGSHAPLMLYVGGDFSGREDDSISFEYREFLTQFISEMCSLPAEDATKVFSGLEDLSVGPLRSMEVGECTSDELSMRLNRCSILTIVRHVSLPRSLKRLFRSRAGRRRQAKASMGRRHLKLVQPGASLRACSLE